MELLLNILWLALAIPAVWFWMRKPAYGSDRQTLGCFRPFLLLACTLIVLFPVVSATDDLNAMRPEMEESSPATRQLKHSAAKSSTNAVTVLATCATINCHFWYEPCGVVSLACPGIPKTASVRETVSRGPPEGVIS